MISHVYQNRADQMIQMKNAYLRVKFRVRTLFTSKKKTMERVGNLKIKQRIAKIKSQGSENLLFNKLETFRKSLRNELLTEGLQ